MKQIQLTDWEIADRLLEKFGKKVNEDYGASEMDAFLDAFDHSYSKTKCFEVGKKWIEKLGWKAVAIRGHESGEQYIWTVEVYDNFEHKEDDEFYHTNIS